ncbi:hypothetical protein AAMO2058_000088800 [Amorphochlora amoebiformis]|uniref:CW-type domain-containing protein n=1 Tax=Amorphochlora amoebiformis TaxID=1561963 RepID=A0A7S0DL58_9EUKA|mmetsp:Transcript_33014/g.53067  ORF Transcript_33014/g.53067 Transcript_33014/m.53067 type:complete len:399 (+) Transcript_33014:100-1296(+)
MTDHWAQCDRCKKWRRTTCKLDVDFFQCSDALRSCEAPEDHFDTSKEMVVGAMSSVENRSVDEKKELEGKSIGFFVDDGEDSDVGLEKGCARHQYALEDCVEKDTSASTAFLAAAQKYAEASIKKRIAKRSLTTWDSGSDEKEFTLPFIIAPMYGKRHAALSRRVFRACPYGLKLRRGAVKLGEKESLECGNESGWLKGIFLAERGSTGAFVFRFDGREVSKEDVIQINLRAEKEKDLRKTKTSHVLQIGSKFIDASDTKLYPNGLLNTNPGGPNSCVFASKMHEDYQKKAPWRSAKNVFLAREYPAGTMLTVDYGSSSYCTEGFLKLELVPHNEEYRQYQREGRRSTSSAPAFPSRRKIKKKRKKRSLTKKQLQEISDAELARKLSAGLRSGRSSSR